MKKNLLILLTATALLSACKKKTTTPEEEPTPTPPVQQTASTFTVSFALVDNTNPLFTGTYSNARKIAFVKSGTTVIDSVIISSSVFSDNGSADYCALSTQYKQTSVVKTQGESNRIYIYEGIVLLADAELKTQNGANSLNDIKYYGDVGSCFAIPGCPTLLAPVK